MVIHAQSAPSFFPVERTHKTVKKRAFNAKWAIALVKRFMVDGKVPPVASRVNRIMTTTG